MGSAAAAVVARQNKYMRRFKEAGAVSAETAVDLVQLGCRDSRLFHRLIDRGVFKSTLTGKYYIDVEAEAEFREARRDRAMAALVLVMAFAVVLLYLTAGK